MSIFVSSKFKLMRDYWVVMVVSNHHINVSKPKLINKCAEN